MQKENKTEQQSPPKRITDQFDNPWKEAIEEYFAECMEFFFPTIHADIDWSQKYEFLDKELEKVIRQAAVSQQRVDKLVSVQRNSGKEALVLLHIDVQSQHATNFSTRMFEYNYRIYDRYKKPVVTLVIYGDESKSWRPDTYSRDLWGFELKMKFPSVKLLDYNLDALMQSTNPFAVVVLAHRHTKATRNKPDERYAFKWHLTRMLYERGYNRAQILSLYRYIDWMMVLPYDLDKKLHTTIIEYEEAQKMTFMIYPERIGYERGIKEGRMEGRQELQRENIIEILMIRFGELPTTLVETVNRIESLELLKTLHKQAAVVVSLPLFERFMSEQAQADNDDDAALEA